MTVMYITITIPNAVKNTTWGLGVSFPYGLTDVKSTGFKADSMSWSVSPFPLSDCRRNACPTARSSVALSIKLETSRVMKSTLREHCVIARPDHSVQTFFRHLFRERLT